MLLIIITNNLISFLSAVLRLLPKQSQMAIIHDHAQYCGFCNVNDIQNLYL